VTGPGYDDLPVLWLTKLRSTLPGVDHTQQVEHCLMHGLIGIGWRMDDLPKSATLEQAVHKIRTTEWDGWGPQAASTVNRFGAEAKVGDFVWTRDTNGRYLLCRLTGGWRYDGSDAAKAVDVHQARDADWAPEPLNDLEVPGGVIRRFVGTSLSFSRIHDPGARRLTRYRWEKLNGRPLPDLNITPREVLTSHLDPYDVEDLIYVWMQVERGYIALPRARQRDTPAYEYSMIHRDTRRRGIAQVKTGSTPVDLNALAAAVTRDDTDTYAFATSGNYDGDSAAVTEIIDTDELLGFVAAHPDLLPLRVRTWFELTSS
jgi:hypothetical protein